MWVRSLSRAGIRGAGRACMAGPAQEGRGSGSAEACLSRGCRSCLGGQQAGRRLVARHRATEVVGGGRGAGERWLHMCHCSMPQ